MSDRYQVLTVPGWNGSGPGHWQTLWEQQNPHFTRVQQRDWERPRFGDWVQTLDRAVESSRGPVVLVAHSLGSLTVARWSETSMHRHKIASALLVAPPWIGRECNCPEAMRDFLPLATQALPIPSLIVASRNDPYMDFDAACRLTEAWKAPLVDAGHAGHINVQSGHGEWPEGRHLLRSLLSHPSKTSKF